MKDVGIRQEMYCEMESLDADGAGVFISHYSNPLDARSEVVK